jgi:hypothetical protein
MQTPTTLVSQKPDYTGLNLSQLIAEHYVIKNELQEIDCDYYEHFCTDPAYTREHKRIRKPYEDKAAALIAALMPFYEQECAQQDWERSFKEIEIGAGA